MIYNAKIINYPKTTGIYKISFYNSENNKFYIWSASGKFGFYGRWKSHKNLLKNNKCKQSYLQNAFNKYGIDNMCFEIVEECDPSICLEREQYYINLFDTYKNGYNSRQNASNNGGLPMSLDAKIKIFNKYKNKRYIYAEDCRRLYNNGKTTREICFILNISRNFLRKIFKENNINIRNDKGIKKKVVYQYDMCGNLIGKYESINSCARKLNINVHGISIVLNGQCKHYKNMYYSYSKLKKENVLDNINNLIIKSKNRKYLNIKQIDKNGNIIKIWRDINEILNSKLYKRNGLMKSLNKDKLYLNYFWMSDKK